MMNSNKRFYYGPQAYCAHTIPMQTASMRQQSTGCSSARLPWGSSPHIVSLELMEESTPETMRFWAKVEHEKIEEKANGTYEIPIYEQVDIHIERNQEKIKDAELPFRSQFWLYLLQLGKVGFILMLPLSIISHMAVIIASDDSWQTVTQELLIGLYPWIVGIPLLSWIIGHTVINHFPKFWFRPPKGPLWEMNRRTGLVTIFGYKRFKKEGVIEEFVAPFYEFDAYMIRAVNRHGPSYGLLLRHRYEDQLINFHTLLRPDDFRQRPCALWDFFQNYMDVSLPLPDIPLFEPHRHLDPVTAKYDKENGRNPRYWIDMDDDVFKAEVSAMWKRIYDINTFRRTNLMARYVTYND